MSDARRDDPLLSERLRADAIKAYPELESAHEASKELQRQMALEEIARLEEEILKIRDELGDEVVWDE